MKVSIDFEVRSKVDLPTYGLDVYSKDPSTEVLCMAYSIDGEEVKLWTPTTQLPQFMFDSQTEFQAWNAAFEFNIMKHVLGLEVKWEQMIDSMACAAANNIPQALEDAAIFLGTEEQKDPIGKRLIQKLCKPKKDGTFDNDPVLLKQLYDYCIKDVKTEMAVARRVRKLSSNEQEIWVATQKINERGVSVDPKELQNAVNAVKLAQNEIDEECVQLTGCKPSERAKLLEWLNQRGAKLEDLTAETVVKMLQRNNLDPQIKRALELRQQGSQTSVAKYEKMLEVQVDGRIRNTLVYHGASTGRWASRGGLNLQNIARPTLSDEGIEEAIERILKEGKGGTMNELSSLVRSSIKAPDGHVFVDADFSSIENRVASWVAGQTDKVEMFRKGLDEYKEFASSALYQIPVEEVTKDMRQIAKSAVLGCMFGQGSKGLIEYADGMGVKLTPEQSQQAVDAYRKSYVKVKSSWYDFEEMAIEAISNPENTYRPVGSRGEKVAFKFSAGNLWVQLPSKRLLCWQAPQIEKQLTPWGAWRDGITVLNQNTFTRKWGRNKLIGSSIFQSIVQATARDLLAEGLLRLEKDGLEVINLIHDEILLIEKSDKGEQTLEAVIKTITQPPKWAQDLPIAAEGWVSERYKK